MADSVGHETAGSGHDADACGYELQGREAPTKSSEWITIEINGSECDMPHEMLSSIDPSYYRRVARAK